MIYAFNNINYMNQWNKVLSSVNPKTMKEEINKRFNVSDPSKWYANNCVFTAEAMNDPYKNFIAEGDKTIVPFKYFLLGYLDYLKDNNKVVQDVDFFFNPRDFPILKQDYYEPYDQIYPNKKLFLHLQLILSLCLWKSIFGPHYQI